MFGSFCQLPPLIVHSLWQLERPSTENTKMALNLDNTHSPSPCHPVSLLTICDQLITLAHETDRAGFRLAASLIVGLALTTLDAECV